MRPLSVVLALSALLLGCAASPPSSDLDDIQFAPNAQPFEDTLNQHMAQELSREPLELPVDATNPLLVGTRLVDPATGKTLRRQEPAAESDRSDPNKPISRLFSAGEGRMLVFFYNEFTDDTELLTCLTAADGTHLWTACTGTCFGMGHFAYCRRARAELRGRYVYVVTTAGLGNTITVLDAATGERVRRWIYDY